MFDPLPAQRERGRLCASAFPSAALAETRQLLVILSLGVLGAAAAWATEPPAGPPDAPPQSESTQPKPDQQESKSSKPATGKPKFHLETLSGQVVWASQALADRFGVKVDADVAESCVALQTDDEIYPIIKDFRGRGFHKDPQLRDRDLELRVRRYEGSPWLQVIKVYTVKSDGKYEMDYWCDICAIPMYELKECECCQGPIRIRERPVAPAEVKSPPRDP